MSETTKKRGRPKGSKNAVKADPKVAMSKPTIIVTKDDKEYSLIQKARIALRKQGCYLYSDKISKFTVRCNSFNKGAVIDRVAKIFPNIFILLIILAVMVFMLVGR